MDGSGGPPARSRMRIGDRERERLLVILREHYADGRLSLDEVRRRTEIVVCATYADEAGRALDELPATTETAAAPASGVPGTDGAPRPQRRGLLSRRGHADAARPAAGWVRTDERFRDPSSGMVMRVWLDPGDGSRHYVPDAAG